MSNRIDDVSERHLRWSTLATLALTAAHHVYGGILYETPWRLHGAVLVLPIGLVIVLGLRRFRGQPSTPAGRWAVWIAMLVALVFPVAVIGAFEGVYNHLAKNILYFAGASPESFDRLFPAPTYEVPNDALFEITGVLQIVPAAWAAVSLVRLARVLGGRARPPGGGKVSPGAKLAARELVTIRSERVSIPDPRGLVHLQLRRFAGCPVCSLHLRAFVRRKDELEAAGVREIVVFHSTAEELARHAATTPLSLVADPDKRLYVELGAESSVRAMLDPRAWLPIVRAVGVALLSIARGEAHAPEARPHGGRFGLPADFLIATDGRVIASHYGEWVDDQWSVDDVLEIAARERGASVGRAATLEPSRA